MAKLTYEEVAQKADFLVQQKLNPTVKSVQTLLGGRSTDDIARHMKKWHEIKSATLQKSWRMPDSISAAVDLEIERRTAEVEARANESRALTSLQTDELFDELKELHEAERSAWAKLQIQLQTDAEIGRRDSLDSAQLRAQIRLLELDLQTRTVQLDVSVQKIKELEVAAALVQKIHEHVRIAESNAEVERKLMGELKKIYCADRDAWAEERRALKKDAEAGHRNSVESAKLFTQVVELDAEVLSAKTRFEKLFEEKEGLQLMADSAQEFEKRAQDAEITVKVLQKDRDHFKVLAETNAQMIVPFLTHMEAEGQGPMVNMAGQLKMQGSFDEARHLRSADL